jgi:hypothetical protein
VHVGVLGIAVTVVVGARRAGRRSRAALAAVATLGQPAAAIATSSAAVGALGPDAWWARGGGAVVVVVEDGARADLVLEGLRRAAVDRVDVVVAVDGSRAVAEVVALVAARHAPRLVLAPVGHQVRGASVPPVDARVSIGAVWLTVEENDPRLVVATVPVTRQRAPPARSGHDGACAPAGAGPQR